MASRHTILNVVDDRLMEISHVIRGENGYQHRASHPIISRIRLAGQHAFFRPCLLSSSHPAMENSAKRWRQIGYSWYFLSPGIMTLWGISTVSEVGYLPDAVLNFLALLGWSPGTT